MSRPEVRQLGDALRRHVQREHDRRGPGQVEATVLDADPLRATIQGQDHELTDQHVTVAAALAHYLSATTPLVVGNTLVLVETDPGDYVAVDVLR